MTDWQYERSGLHTLRRYFRCLPMSPAISSIETCFLPKMRSSLMSATISRLLPASCRPRDCIHRDAIIARTNKPMDIQCESMAD